MTAISLNSRTVSSLTAHHEQLILKSSPTRSSSATLAPGRIVSSPPSSPSKLRSSPTPSALVSMASVATPAVIAEETPASVDSAELKVAPEDGDSGSAATPALVATADSPLTRIITLLPGLSVQEQATITANLERLGTYPKELPLSSSWTLYFSGKATSNSAGEYVENHIPIFTATTVPELCGSLKAYKTLSRSKRARPAEPSLLLGNLKAGQNLHFFARDIIPSWEAAENAKGGRLTISPSSANFDPTFERLILLLAGSALESATSTLLANPAGEGYITGVVASRRPRGDRIELWLGGKDASAPPPGEWLEKLKEALADELEMPELKTTKYKRHF